MNTEIYEQLKQLAFEKTKPFCYFCYKEALTGRCSICGTDDLMRLLPGVGCEYGIDWAISEILSEELTPFDLSESFEQSIRECYPEVTKIGWLSLDTVSVMKEMDSVSWNMAQSDWESNECEEGRIVTLDNGCTYYQTFEIEALLADHSIMNTGDQ